MGRKRVQKISTTARVNNAGEVELFYYDDEGWLVSYTIEDGHNITDLKYMKECYELEPDLMKEVVKKYNEQFGNTHLVYIGKARLHNLTHKGNNNEIND